MPGVAQAFRERARVNSTSQARSSMRVRSTVLILSFAMPLCASEALDRAHHLEDTGDSVAAREAFAAAVKTTPNDAELLDGYAEVLERYHDPAARSVYRRAAEAWKKDGKTPNAMGAYRQAVLLDLIAGDNKAAASDLAEYKSAGGTDLQLSESPASAAVASPMVEI